MIFDAYENAVEFYKKALHESEGKPDVGRVRYHLGEALYRLGKKEEALALMKQGLQEIREKAAGLDSFLKNVWESGSLMRLAQLIQTDSPDESKRYLEEARNVIDSDSRLVLRKKQLEDLLNTYK